MAAASGHCLTRGGWPVRAVAGSKRDWSLPWERVPSPVLGEGIRQVLASSAGGRPRRGHIGAALLADPCAEAEQRGLGRGSPPRGWGRPSAKCWPLQRAAAHVAGTSAPPSWLIRAPKRSSAGWGEIFPALRPSPCRKVIDRSIRL